MEKHFEYEYYGQTTVHPIGLAALIVLGIALLLLPRRYAVWPIIVMACFIAPAQRIAVFTLNFDLLRIMVLFGSVRVLVRGETKEFVWHSLDIAVVAWAVVGTTAYILFWGDGSAIKYKLGVLYDIIGMHFMFRCLVRDWSDVAFVTAGFALASVPVAAAFLVEHSTGRNMFAILGGVPEITVVRDGRLRCQGAFAHAILAGCFWAAVLPMMVVQLLNRGKSRALAVVGICASCVIIVTCASSTPVMAALFVVVGFAFFPLRGQMRWIRWGLVVVLVSLHMTMKQPVWHLVARVDLAGGSTGYHRFLLIDRAIDNFGDWWLLGTDSTERWLEGLYDVTNQYILEGVRGGVVGTALFVLIIALGFRTAGRLCRAHSADRKTVIVAWACGVAVFVHAMNFIGVSYFGQINMVWHLLLATLASLATLPSRPAQGGERKRHRRYGLRGTALRAADGGETGATSPAGVFTGAAAC
jgi:hypothetical protein